MTVHRLRSTRLTTLVVGIGGTAVLLAACSTASTGAASSSGAPSRLRPRRAPPRPEGSSASASGPSSADELGVIDPSTLPVTIPFDYVANHPVVETGFGTAETFPMILDTGAPVNVSADLVQKFGFPVVGQQTGAAAGGTVTSDMVGVDTVTMGDLTVSTVAAITPWVDKANPLSCISENGLVGSNVMKDAVWQIDYQAKTVTVTASTDGIDHVTGAIPVPFRTPGDTPDGSPNVAFGVGNDGLIFLVDTGSDGGIIAAPKELESVGVTIPKDAPVVKSLAAGAAGNVALDIPFVTTTIDLGGKKIDYPVGAADIVQGVGNIGNAFLSQFIVTFDYPNKTIYLDPVSAGRNGRCPARQGSQHRVGRHEGDRRRPRRGWPCRQGRPQARRHRDRRRRHAHHHTRRVLRLHDGARPQDDHHRRGHVRRRTHRQLLHEAVARAHPMVGTRRAPRFQGRRCGIVTRVNDDSVNEEAARTE